MSRQAIRQLGMRHALSIDVEDWYHDGGSPPGASQERVESNTARLLDLFAAHDATATFFFLGEVAERYPQLVRRVAAAGHEIGSHGYRHVKVSEMTRGEFRADVARSLRVLEELIGQPVRGYRAPYFSIKADVKWPIDILAELGVQYDASILAIDRPPGLELVCPRQPYRLHNGLWEVPVALLRLFGVWHLPLASGSGLRLLPGSLFERLVQGFERDVGRGVFYLHPWELDPQSPTAPGFGRWFIRAGRQRLESRLSSLLTRRGFSTIPEAFSELNLRADA